MSEQTYPATYRNEDGVELIANNDLQEHIYKREGFKLVVEKPAAKK